MRSIPADRLPQQTAAASAGAPPATGVRERILAAAVELLHEQGIKDFTQTSVSRRAGVRQSHLTYYFPTRNDLLKHAVLSGMASVLAMIDPPAATGTESVQRFREVLEAQLQDRRVARMMTGLVVASEEDRSLKPWLEQFTADMLANFERSLAARGVRAARAELELFHATLVGAAQLDLAASSAESSRSTGLILRLALDRLLERAASASPPATKRRLKRPPRT